MKTKKILTFEEAKENATYCKYYSESVYQYQIKGVYHLIKDGKDVLAGLEATCCTYYGIGDGVYKYEVNGVYHLIIGGKDVLAGLKATYCYYIRDGVYQYIANGVYHLNIDGKDVLAGLNATYCYYIRDGVYKYIANGVYHLVIGGKDVLEGLNADNCLYYPDGVYQYQIKGVWVTVNLKEEIAKILKKYEKKADTILLCSDYEDFLYIFKKYTKKTTEEIRNMKFGSLSISEICMFFGIKVQLTICSQYILNINKNEK